MIKNTKTPANSELRENNAEMFPTAQHHYFAVNQTSPIATTPTTANNNSSSTSNSIVNTPPVSSLPKPAITSTNNNTNNNQAGLFQGDRTFTLPSRFKKRLLSASIASAGYFGSTGASSPLPATTTTTTNVANSSSPVVASFSSLDHLIKLVDGLLKSLKHLEVC